MDNQKKKVIIADAQYLSTKGLCALFDELGDFVPEVAPTAYDLEKRLGQGTCELLVVDPFSIDFDGFGELLQIRQQHPQIAILVLTNTVCKPDVVEINKAGIKNIVLKSAGFDELNAAIGATIKGKKYYSDEIVDMLLDIPERGKPMVEEAAKLTNAELEIVKLISSGLTTKEIANSKHISFHTVNTHRKNIFRKLGVTNASELIMHAIKAGWIDNIEYYI